ncbi:MAG: hypothetical protein MI919_22545 [Holophagales bacterium]|nr:hypothetical protein [Holophagales bacterium]
MLSHSLVFLLGVFLAPLVRPALRPLFVEVVRAILRLVGEIRRLAAEAREGLEDAVAEAEASRARAAPPSDTFTDSAAPAGAGSNEGGST